MGSALILRRCLLFGFGASASVVAALAPAALTSEAAGDPAFPAIASRVVSAASLLPLANLPIPLPTPSPPKAVTPGVSPPSPPPVKLPPGVPSPVPLPTLPALTPSPSVSPLPGRTPSPSPSPRGVGAGGSGNTGGSTTSRGPGAGHDPRGGGLTVPVINFVLNSPFNVGLAGALAVLPLLFGLWLLLFGRTWTEARRAKDARIRLMLAGELGLAPRELNSLSMKSLYKLREEAAFDELTGVLRRAAGMSALEREVARARRMKTPLTVAFMDVDGLKQANDARGHKAGDELLRGMANALTGGLRGQDLVMRYGGDEFVCVLPDTVCDAGRAKLSWIQTDAMKAGIRFSVGLATLERSDDTVSLLGRADRELYQAKANKVQVINRRREGGAQRRASA